MAAGASTRAGRSSHSRLMLGVAAVVVVLDQLTKWWAENRLERGHIDIVWTLRLNLVRNPGSAFSVGRSLGPLLGVLAVVVMLVLVRVGRLVGNTPTAVALGLVLGGATGNLIDRAFRDGHGFLGGHVIDFIDLQWWPVFNVADSGIVIGGVLLALLASRADARAAA